MLCELYSVLCFFFFFMQKTAYEMRISDWSSDVCSSDLGCIGIYDATAGYRREAELEAYAIGPHEMVLLSDGRTLAVANGGIQTHPARRREKLNIDTMQPSLAYIDAESGALLHDHRLQPALHPASIRPIAATAGATVGVVLTAERPRHPIENGQE